MFRFFRTSEELRLIDAGRVSCPLRSGDADITDCMQCGFAKDVATGAKTPFVRCQPPRRLLLLP